MSKSSGRLGLLSQVSAPSLVERQEVSWRGSGYGVGVGSRNVREFCCSGKAQECCSQTERENFWSMRSSRGRSCFRFQLKTYFAESWQPQVSWRHATSRVRKLQLHRNETEIRVFLEKLSPRVSNGLPVLPIIPRLCC